MAQMRVEPALTHAGRLHSRAEVVVIGVGIASLCAAKIKKFVTLADTPVLRLDVVTLK